MLNNTNITNIKSALKDKVILKTVSRKLAKPKTTLDPAGTNTNYKKMN